MGRTHDCQREVACRARLHGRVGGLQQAPAAAGRHVLHDVADVLQLDAAELRALRQQAAQHEQGLFESELQTLEKGKKIAIPESFNARK